MMNAGSILFWSGVAISVLIGVLMTLCLGTVCNLDAGVPKTLMSYPALCFTVWAFGPPIGLILAATGMVLQSGASRGATGLFGFGVMAAYLTIAYVNGPMPHVPPLFGIGGALILGFYFAILWMSAGNGRSNGIRIAGYTFLVIGFWFTCGLAGRPYHEVLGDGQSPIDIMVYFVLGMGFLCLDEWLRRRHRGESLRGGAAAPA